MMEVIPCFHIRAGQFFWPALAVSFAYFYIFRDILILYSYGDRLYRIREVTYEQKELG